MKKHLFTLLICFLLFASVHGFCETSIKIGATLPLSGGAAFWGTNSQRGIELAVDGVNKSGGINGVPLEVIYEDFGELDLKRAASGARKLIDVDKVRVMLTEWTEDNEVVSPMALKANIVTINLTGGGKGLTKRNPLLFRVWPPDEQLVEAELDYAIQNGTKKAAVIALQTAYFQSLKDSLLEIWKKKTGAEAFVQDLGMDITDYKPYLLKVKQGGYDALFLYMAIERVALPLKQIMQLKIDLTRFGIQHSDEATVIQNAAGGAEGLIFAEHPAATSDFANKFKAHFGKEAGVSSDNAYDAIKLLSIAMRRHGISTEQIKQGLLETKDYNGASGKITFNQDRDREPGVVLIKKIQNGKGVVVKEVQAGGAGN